VAKLFTTAIVNIAPLIAWPQILWRGLYVLLCHIGSGLKFGQAIAGKPLVVFYHYTILDGHLTPDHSVLARTRLELW